MALLALILLLGLVILIIWLSVHPRKFHYSIEHAVISKYNLTNNRLNSNFYMVLRAENPNRRMSMYYDRIDVTVLYEDQKLSINNVHPFYQPRRNITHLDMYLVAKDATVYGAVARDLGMHQASGGALSLDVKIKAKIRQKVGVFKIHRKLKIFCGKVNVPFDTKKGFQRVFCDADLD
ncbi:unnamed protein product [Cuscuta campestris]|uniref:Late embryogenesis abundant protein LEA-2 subgroup domain-containing protein n=2 Tax=Cuscuta sect. Cleistogrammica TaxID=1824901 RepID=A0A484L8D1_9ASTE|nr:hypothetical protein DM860_010993 [Cuscuta australis]VFQ72619.1 unnamed protein product [Cuscuta campestris]